MPPAPVLNRAHPLAWGLVGAWHFNEPGRPRDVAQRQDAGYVFHPAARSAAGRGMVAAGVSGCPLPADCALSKLRYNMSVEAWVTRTTATAYGHIIAYSPAQGWALRMSDSGSDLMMFTGSGSGHEFFGYTMAANVLTHILVTVTASTAQLHVNGAFDRSTAVSWGIAAGTGASNNKAIGAYADTSTFSFPGNIFSVRVWDRTLPPQAAASLYADPWALYRPARRTLRGTQAAAARAYYYRNFVASGAHQ